MSTLAIKETLDPGLKAGLFKNFSNHLEALLEIIDNSVAQRIEGQPMVIKILLIPGSKKIEIIDSGGKGMGFPQLEAFFQWGLQKKRTKQDIGLYSQGGKAAIGYIGRAFRLLTSPQNSNIAYQIQDYDYHDTSKLKEYVVEQVHSNRKEGYTHIAIEKVKTPLTDHFQKNLVERLSETYRPLLSSGVVEIRINTEKIIPQDLPLDPESPKQAFSFQIHDSDDITIVDGWITHQIPRSGVKGGMRVYYRGRLISSREFFGHPDPSYKQTLNYLFGEVYVDELVSPNMNKTDFDRDSSPWRQLEESMHDLLQPYIDELLGRTVEEPSEEEMERLKKTRELLKQILKLSKQEQLFENFELEGDEGIKPPESLNVEQQVKPAGSHNMDKDYKPKTSAPSDAVGKRKRLQNFTDWELRNMDDTTRSVVEEVKIKGRVIKKLVINNVFPGYKVFKGNELYLLETYALQLLPVDSEGLPVEKYREEFDRFFATICRYVDEAKANLTKKQRK